MKKIVRSENAKLNQREKCVGSENAKLNRREKNVRSKNAKLNRRENKSVYSKWPISMFYKT